MAANLEAVDNVVKQYVAEVRRVMPIDKAVLFGSYAKGTAALYCTFSPLRARTARR